MCGIAGLVLPGQTISAEWLAALDRGLAHRGPDDRGFLGWRSGDIGRPSRDPAEVAGQPVALVHRRLSILELSELGWQPMVSPDRRAAIAFNGEVYNFAELRAELEPLGHHFVGGSDTEVVLAAWRQWGTEAFPRFTGMFALAILDLERWRLVLARDPFGIKPLYWAPWRGGCAFASEIPPLLDLPGMSRAADPAAVFDYLRFGHSDRGEATMLAGIRRLPAGHWLDISLDDGTVGKPQAYWRLAPDTVDISADEAADELRRLFLDSARLHLRADVPVGIALSGGIDSSAILGATRALGGKGDIHAFSFISEDIGQSEEGWIDTMAAAADVQVHKTRPQAGDLAAELDALIAAQGEPFATTGMFAQSKVFALVREHSIKVSLDGQGADEMLAGYPTYRAARLADLMAHGNPAALRLARAGGAGTVMRAGGMLLPASLQGLMRRLVGEEVAPAWLNADWFAGAGVTAAAPVLKRRRDYLHDRLEQTFTDLSLPALLRYADRNSMAHSVESRVPFLTPALAQFILSLPAHLLMDDAGTGKVVFRRAMRGLVPDAILDRRDKIGFAVPEARWLGALSPWVERTLDGPVTALPMLRAEVARADWHAALRGKRRWDNRFWRWLNLAVWSERFGIRY